MYNSVLTRSDHAAKDAEELEFQLFRMQDNLKEIAKRWHVAGIDQTKEDNWVVVYAQNDGDSCKVTYPFSCLISSSGSWKSTLLRCLNFLEKKDNGKIIINGEEVTQETHDINEVRQKVGMVFQHFQLFPHNTVLENIIEAPLMVKKLPKEQAVQEERSLQKVGLSDKADVYPNKLSGGQKQRVAIARALAMKPEIMLFDEPTSALDPELVGEVLAEEGMTMVVVTHEMQFAREVADWIVYMNESSIIERGHPDDFFTSKRRTHERIFKNDTIKIA